LASVQSVVVASNVTVRASLKSKLETEWITGTLAAWLAQNETCHPQIARTGRDTRDTRRSGGYRAVTG
jgi:hypothetical protein